jgi:aspartyl-tRNA synthetase
MLTNINFLKPNSTKTIQGFVENIRNKNNICFLVVKDVTGKIQVTVVKDKSNISEEFLQKITPQSVVTIKGKIIENPNVKLNGVELIPDTIKLETIAASPLPIDNTSLIDTKLDYRWIDLRSERNQLIYKVQTYITNVMRQ